MSIYKSIIVLFSTLLLCAYSSKAEINQANDVIILKPELSSYDKKQIQCLADNAYYEAGNQSVKGMVAVTQVVLNRTKHEKFPETPCSVIRQKQGSVCQFSWTCNRPKVLYAENYEKAKIIAKNVYLNNPPDITNGAIYYHATYVKPTWFRKLKRTVIIGQHIFYR